MLKKLGDNIKGMVRVYGREFRLVFSDPGLILFFLFLPLAYPIIYSLIYNPELVRNVPMVVVDHDRTAESRELVRQMDASEGCRIIGYAANLNEAREAMNSHKCYSILEIPEYYGRDLGRGEVVNPVIYAEMSLLLRYRAILVAANAVSQHIGAQMQVKRLNQDMPIASSLVTGDPMPVASISMGNIESGFCSFIMPGVIILIIHQCIVLAVGMSGGAKHEDPRMIGYNPINRCSSTLFTMLGQMMCYITIMILPILYITHYVPLMFSFPMRGDYLEILIFIVPLLIAAVSLGFCMQALMWERESVMVLWVVTSLIFLFLSGLTWPRYMFSPFWSALSAICPTTWGVEGFIVMNSNGSSLSQVAPLWRNLWICAGGYFLLAYVVQRFVVAPTEGKSLLRVAAERRRQ